MNNKRVQALIWVVFSFLTLAYVLRDLNTKDLLKQLNGIKYGSLCTASVCMFTSVWFRNLRWILLLKPLGISITKKQTFTAILISYPSNLVVPLSSTFVRASYLKKISGLSIPESLGTILVEKFLDGILLLASLLFFMYYSISINQLFKGQQISNVIYVAISILFVFVLLSQTKLKKPLSSFYAKIKSGINAARKNDRQLTVILYSIMIWLSNIMMFYFLLEATSLITSFSLNLPFELATMANLGFIFPSHGGIGSYHLCISKLLEFRSFDESFSVFYAFLSHSFIIFNDLFFGFCAVIINYESILNLLNLKKGFLMHAKINL